MYATAVKVTFPLTGLLGTCNREVAQQHNTDLHLALDGDAGGQLAPGPGPVRLAEDALPPDHREARLALVTHLAAVMGAAPILRLEL